MFAQVGQDSESKLYVVALSGGGAAQLPTRGSGAWSPSVARDWTLLYISDINTRDLVAQTINDPSTAVTFPSTLEYARPEFRPEGTITAPPANWPPAGVGTTPPTTPPPPTSPPPTSPPPPPTLKVGAWGDSYMSGEGAPDPELGYLFSSDQPDNRCHRSSRAFAALIAKQLGRGLDFHACSGAVLADYVRPYSENHNGKNPGELAQQDTVTQQNDIGFVALGGNNTYFEEVMTYCATRARYQSTCEQTFGKKVEGQLKRLESLNVLEQLYRDIVQRMAPSAKLYVIGYPRFFPVCPPGSCWTGIAFPQRPTFIRSDMVWINNAISQFNVIALRAAARVGGAKFIDVYDVFDGREICNLGNRPALMNRGITNVDGNVRAGSFHPNVQGHAAEARWITARMT